MAERIMDTLADNILFAFYSVFVMSAWIYDSLNGTHRFNISDITMLGWQILALHGGNSLLNSPYGVMPSRPYQGTPTVPIINKQGGNSQNDNMRP